MPKVKTLKSLSKRIKRTGTGKIKRRAAFISHLQSKKSSARKRRHKGNFDITGKYKRQVKRLVPY